MDDELDTNLTWGQLQSILEVAILNQAPGVDGILVEFYLNTSVSLMDYILILFIYIFINAETTRNFKSSIIYPVFREETCCIFESCRGISFVNASAKLFTEIL